MLDVRSGSFITTADGKYTWRRSNTSADIPFIVSIGLSVMSFRPCHYLCFCFLLSSCFSRGRGLYPQLVTFHHWGVLYGCAAGAESDGQVQFWTSGHRGWSGAMWARVGLRKREWRRSHAGGDREVLSFKLKFQLNFQQILLQKHLLTIAFNFSSALSRT